MTFPAYETLALEPRGEHLLLVHAQSRPGS